MKAGGSGQNARQHYLETKEQHLWGEGGVYGVGGVGGVDVHLGIQHADGSRLWAGEGDVHVYVHENMNILEPASSVRSQHAAVP